VLSFCSITADALCWLNGSHCKQQTKLNHGATHWNSDIYATKRQGKVAHKPRRPKRPELNPVSVAWSNWEYCYSPLDGMLVHHRLTTSNMLAVPVYTPGWREKMWHKVSGLRKQHDGRDWASNNRPSDQCANHYTTPLPTKCQGTTKKCVC